MRVKLNDWLMAWLLVSVIIFLGFLQGFTWLFKSRLYGAIACGCFYLMLTVWFRLIIYLDDRKYYRQKAKEREVVILGNTRTALDELD